MNTLDEVIIGIREQMGFGDPILIDALHYLKEYKNTDENYKKAIAHVTEVIDHYEKMVADYLSVNNPALTWDELRTMEGKPVWIEMDGYKPNWGIVMNQDKRNGRLMLCGYDEVEIRMEINEEGEGTGWQAYRKERGNETD